MLGFSPYWDFRIHDLLDVFHPPKYTLWRFSIGSNPWEIPYKARFALLEGFQPSGWGVGIPDFSLREKSRAPAEASAPKCYGRATGTSA